jgi:hypothetical protein
MIRKALHKTNTYQKSSNKKDKKQITDLHQVIKTVP